jgi:hypothetical protein
VDLDDASYLAEWIALQPMRSTSGRTAWYRSLHVAYLRVRDGERFVYHSSKTVRARESSEWFPGARQAGTREDAPRMCAGEPHCAAAAPCNPHHPTDTALLDWLLTRLYRLTGARGQSDLWAMTCFLPPLGRREPGHSRTFGSSCPAPWRPTANSRPASALNRAGQRCYTAAFVKFVRKTP